MERIGRYEVRGELGRGGMGAVYRVWDPKLGRELALKVVVPVPGAAGELERFLQEGRAVGRLRHPGIVTVHDVGQVNGRPYLVMDLVAGGSVQQALEEGGPLDPREAARIAAEVADALAHAHARGVLHRDLKPANVLLHPDGSAVLTDFGLARLVDRETRLSATGELLGTPAYMPPEQANGERGRIGPASDVYGLGATLYAMLNGGPPFQRATVLSLLDAVLSERPESLRELRPDLDPGLEAIVLRCLEKDTARRYPDAEALGRALRGWLDGRAPAPGRGRLPALAGALLALGAVGGLIAHVTRRPAPAPSPSASPASSPPPAPPQVDPTGEQVLVLQPGPLGGKDTYVRNDGLNGNDNFGLERVMSVGDRSSNQQQGDFRAYLQFDLSRLPAGAAVEGATLTLFVQAPALQGRGLTVEAWRVVPSRADGRTPWREGTGGLDGGLDGMCWDGDRAGAPYPQATSRRPDLSQPPVDTTTDFGHGPTGLLSRRRVAADASSFDVDLTGAVRIWAAHPGQNQGVRLTHRPEGPPFDDGHLNLYSSDSALAARRPRLTIRYRGLPPGPAPDARAARAALRRELEPELHELEKEVPVSDERLERARRLVERAPFWGEALYVRGRLHRLRDQRQQALVDLCRAQDAVEPCRERDLPAMIAEQRLIRGDLPGAKARVTAGLRLHPDDPWLLITRANLLAKWGDRQGAQAGVARARDLAAARIRADPDDARAYWVLSVTSALRRDRRGALEAARAGMAAAKRAGRGLDALELAELIKRLGRSSGR